MGPLSGVRIVEIAGIGPGPFAAMMLADMGADVVRVDRAVAVTGGDPARPPLDIMNRGRRSIGVDLKHPDGVETVLALVEQADGLIEGFRPGVTERLGIGPDACLARNPRLVYGRMTGWGQDGPMAQMAGHDMNYIAIAGALGAIGRPDERPQPPLNLVGDFGGGGMLLAFGLVCGILEARTSGEGQVVDAAMVDGTAVLTTFMHGMMAMGGLEGRAGESTCSTPAPTSTRSTSAPTAGSCRSARSSRSSTPRCSPGPAWPTTRTSPADSDDRSTWPAPQGAPGRGVRHPEPRRVGRRLRRHRRLRGPGPVARRGPAAPAQRRPGDLRGDRRRGAAGPGAAVLAHRPARSSGRPPTPASTPTRSSPNGVSPMASASMRSGRQAPSPDPSGPGRGGGGRR